MLLFSRWEHGHKKVLLNENEIIIEGNSFPSWKKACEYLYGRPTSISREKYFRREIPFREFLHFREDLSKDLNEEIDLFCSQLSHFLENKLGIDMSAKLPDIRRLVYAGFAKKVSGHDPEDIFQEVLKGLLIRNKGSCPYDPKKSSFSSYVYMVASCVIANYHQKQSKYNNVGLPQEPAVLDLARESSLQESSLEQYVFSKIPNTEISKKIFDMTLKGYKIAEMSRSLKCSNSKASKIVRQIKQAASQWAVEQGLDSLVPEKFRN